MKTAGMMRLCINSLRLALSRRAPALRVCALVLLGAFAAGCWSPHSPEAARLPEGHGAVRLFFTSVLGRTAIPDFEAVLTAYDRFDLEFIYTTGTNAGEPAMVGQPPELKLWGIPRDRINDLIAIPDGTFQLLVTAHGAGVSDAVGGSVADFTVDITNDWSNPCPVGVVILKVPLPGELYSRSSMYAEVSFEGVSGGRVESATITYLDGNGDRIGKTRPSAPSLIDENKWEGPTLVPGTADRWEGGVWKPRITGNFGEEAGIYEVELRITVLSDADGAVPETFVSRHTVWVYPNVPTYLKYSFEYDGTAGNIKLGEINFVWYDSWDTGKNDPHDGWLLAPINSIPFALYWDGDSKAEIKGRTITLSKANLHHIKLHLFKEYYGTPFKDVRWYFNSGRANPTKSGFDFVIDTRAGEPSDVNTQSLAEGFYTLSVVGTTTQGVVNGVQYKEDIEFYDYLYIRIVNDPVAEDERILLPNLNLDVDAHGTHLGREGFGYPTKKIKIKESFFDLIMSDTNPPAGSKLVITYSFAPPVWDGGTGQMGRIDYNAPIIGNNDYTYLDLYGGLPQTNGLFYSGPWMDSMTLKADGNITQEIDIWTIRSILKAHETGPMNGVIPAPNNKMDNILLHVWATEDDANIPMMESVYYYPGN